MCVIGLGAVMCKKACFFVCMVTWSAWFTGAVCSARADPIIIVCSTDNPEGSFHHLALQKFDELIRAYSDGRMQAQIHYRGSAVFPAIRGEEINVNMVMSGGGGVDVTIVAVGNVAQRAGILNSLMLPYIFPNIEAAQKVLQSEYMLKDINNVLAEQHGVRVLGWLIGGFRHMTNSRRPVTRIENMEGLIIRTPRNRLMHDTYAAFGARPLALDWADTFDALKKGMADGQENPYNVIYTSAFWKANQGYLTHNGPFLWTGPMLIHEEFYRRLSPEFQDIVNRAAEEAAQHQWQWTAERDEEYRQKLLAKGMSLLDLEDKEKWIEAARPLWEQYYHTIGYGDASKGEATVERILSIIQH